MARFMDKKNRYITFCVSESNYNKLLQAAIKDRRKLASYIAIIIEDHITKNENK